MRERALEKALTEVLRSSLGLSQEREDALWSRFAARRAQEATAWAVFAASMALMTVRLRPAIRSCGWPGSFHPKW
jgi:hypothetical protein